MKINISGRFINYLHGAIWLRMPDQEVGIDGINILSMHRNGVCMHVVKLKTRLAIKASSEVLQEVMVLSIR